MFSFPRFSMLAVALAASLMLSAPAARAQTAASPVVISGPAGQITQEDVETGVRDLVPPEQRALFWVTPDAAERLVRNLYAQRALAVQAEQEGLDRTPQAQAYLRLMRERTLMRLLLDEHAKAAQPDEKAIKAYAQSEYIGKPERFALPEEVHARHILIAEAKDCSDGAQARAKAEALLGELRQGADFAKLAQDNSADPGSAQRGGDLGFFPRGKMVPAFEEAVFGLQKPGDLAGPVKTPFGYHIIELLERKPAGTRTFEEVLPELKKELAAKLDGQERQQLWDAALAPAQVDEASLRALKTSHAQDEKQKP